MQEKNQPNLFAVKRMLLFAIFRMINDNDSVWCDCLHESDQVRALKINVTNYRYILI